MLFPERQGLDAPVAVGVELQIGGTGCAGPELFRRAAAPNRDERLPGKDTVMRYARPLTVAVVAAIVGILLYLHTPPAHGTQPSPAQAASHR